MRLKKLSTDISAVCPLQDPRETYYARFKPNIDPLSPKNQAGFRRRNINRGPSRSA